MSRELSEAQMQSFYKRKSPVESDPSKDKRGNAGKVATRRSIEDKLEEKRIAKGWLTIDNA